MRFLVLLLIGQITISVFLLNLTPVKLQQAKKILGVKIAQGEESPSSQPSPNTNADVTPEPSVDNKSLESTPESTPGLTTEPITSPEPNTDLKIELPSPQPTSFVTPPILDRITNILPPESPIPEVTDLELQNTQAVINPDVLLSNPDNIDSTIVDTAQKQDRQLDQVKNPNQKTDLVISNVLATVRQLDQTVHHDDFASTNFLSQRFNVRFDQVLENIAKQLPDQAIQAKKQLKAVCNQTDSAFRTLQLSVPEDVEQDLEINRGRCLSL